VRGREVIVDRDRDVVEDNGQAADEPLTAEREATTATTIDRTTDRETVR